MAHDSSAVATNELDLAIHRLVAYCQANDWAGNDPYDALNSRLFAALPFLNSRLPRLLLTQALKRSPGNPRPLLLIPKTLNPKAIALFLSAFLKLSGTGMDTAQAMVHLMIQRLVELRSPNMPYWCWGYSFPWQTRTIVVPSRAPNLVCTTFVAAALLEAYEQCEQSQCLSMAVSAAEYLLKDLYWSNGTDVAGFSYPLSSVRNQVHNANLLAAALLARVYKHTGDSTFLRPALQVARYSAAQQRANGSWDYGEAPTQRWIDNFHTGYNLCALQSLATYLETDEFDRCMRQGFHFYRSHFFRHDGAVQYFHDRTYPIDIHCVAQSIITLLELKHFDSDNFLLARSVFGWAMKHLWDKQGFFYYRVLRYWKIKTSYMRWSQAWMLQAMATLRCASHCAPQQPAQDSSFPLMVTCGKDPKRPS